MSDPVARVVVPLARAAPDPPEDPDGVYLVSQGVTVVPWSRLVVVQALQNSPGIYRIQKAVFNYRAGKLQRWGLYSPPYMAHAHITFS